MNKIWKELIKWLDKKICRHLDLTIAVDLSEESRVYHVICPHCKKQLQIKVVGYKLIPNARKLAPECNKKLYTTEKDARTVKNWQETHGFVKELRCYYCKLHSGWHLTKKIN